MSREIVEQLEQDGKRLVIAYEENPWNPREWDNTGKMLCFHDRYALGDTRLPYESSQYGSWREVHAALVEDGAVCIRPLYLYDHGGITISMGKGEYDGDTRRGWDSGQVGFIYIDPSDPMAEGLDFADLDRLEHILACEVDTYDKYLTGEVLWFRVEQDTTCSCCGHTTTEVLDSCGGFYTIDEAVEAAGFQRKAVA